MTSKHSFSLELIDYAINLIKNRSALEKDNTINQVDLKRLKTYTIDNDDTFEIDDALSLESINNTYRIWIHISCPSIYIPFNSILDKEARKRAATIYYVDKTETMFPEILIHEILSLTQNKDKKCISVGVELNNDGSIANTIINQTTININYNLTYDDANELIELSPKEDKQLEILFNLLKLRQQWRLKEGAITIDEIRGQPSLENNKMSIKYIEPSKARFIVSESMVLIGSAVAEFCYKNLIPIPFRCQDRNRKEYNKSNNIILNNFSLKSSFTNTYLSLNPNNHFGLGLTSYVQVSSPIRRYSDLLIHHQLLSYINNNNLISKEKIGSISNDNFKSIKEHNQIIKLDQLKAMSIFFNQNISVNWSIYFLRCIDIKKSLYLIHFIDLSMDLIVSINNLQEPSFGDFYNIILNDKNYNNDKINFNIV